MHVKDSWKIDIKINGNRVYYRDRSITWNPGCISAHRICITWPDTGMCGLYGADDDISHSGLADDWRSTCNSGRKQSGNVLWYRSDNAYAKYRIWSGGVCWIMMIENDFASR